MVNCHWCKRSLAKGEQAYVQSIKVTKVVGNKVTHSINEVISCVTCAK